MTEFRFGWVREHDASTLLLVMQVPLDDGSDDYRLQDVVLEEYTLSGERAWPAYARISEDAPIDSADVDPKLWDRLARKIQAEFENAYRKCVELRSDVWAKAWEAEQERIQALREEAGVKGAA